MANVIIDDKHLNDIAEAIRSKNGTNETYKPSEMADAITALPTDPTSGIVEPIPLAIKEVYFQNTPYIEYRTSDWKEAGSTMPFSTIYYIIDTSNIKDKFELRFEFDVEFYDSTSRAVFNAWTNPVIGKETDPGRWAEGYIPIDIDAVPYSLISYDTRYPVGVTGLIEKDIKAGYYTMKFNEDVDSICFTCSFTHKNASSVLDSGFGKFRLYNIWSLGSWV